MKENKEDFLNKLLSFFPNKADEYKAFLLEYVEDDEGMETVIIEDIFMPDLVELLEKIRIQND